MFMTISKALAVVIIVLNIFFILRNKHDLSGKNASIMLFLMSLSVFFSLVDF